MKYNSAFDIIGPVMVGPSSSHTAGAVRIGNLARQILGEEPRSVSFRLMGSFAETYQGHGSDVALLGGILGLPTDHPEVPNAFDLAKQHHLEYEFKKANLGFYHPNTVAIELRGETRTISVIASSLGGGKVEIQEVEGLRVTFTGDKPTLILHHRDEQGFLAKVSHVLDSHGYNIARLSLERWTKGGPAITVCEVDDAITSDILDLLKSSITCLKDVRIVQNL